MYLDGLCPRKVEGILVDGGRDYELMLADGIKGVQFGDWRLSKTVEE